MKTIIITRCKGACIHTCSIWVGWANPKYDPVANTWHSIDPRANAWYRMPDSQYPAVIKDIFGVCPRPGGMIVLERGKVVKRT